MSARVACGVMLIAGLGNLSAQSSPQRGPVLELTVTDQGGRPVQQAFVNYRNLRDGLGGGGATDATGTIRLLLRSGGGNASESDPYRIEVVHPGSKLLVLPDMKLAAGSTERLSVTLEPRGAFVPLDPTTYARRAAEHVLAAARGPAKAKADVSVRSAPAVLPPAVRERRPDSSPPPDAFVEVTLAVNGRFREPVLVAFTDEQPDALFSYRGGAGFMPLEEDEWRTVATALAPFYAAAADVSRGPDRFYEFLPEDMRKVLDRESEKGRFYLPLAAVTRDLSNDQLRRFIALYFDAAAQNRLLMLHGLAGATLPRPVTTRTSPSDAIAGFEIAAADATQRLRAAGALDQKHLQEMAPYVRRLLGEGPLVREDPARDGITGLRRGERVYAVHLGIDMLFPHFTIRDGRAMLVSVDLR